MAWPYRDHQHPVLGTAAFSRTAHHLVGDDDGDDGNLYHGLALGDHDIRLLAIHPDPQQTGQVVCTLTRHSLDDTTDAYRVFLAAAAAAAAEPSRDSDGNETGNGPATPLATAPAADSGTPGPRLSKRQLTTLWKTHSPSLLATNRAGPNPHPNPNPTPNPPLTLNLHQPTTTTTTTPSASLPPPIAARHARAPPRSRQRWAWGDYAALSYAWGDERDRADVVVNGRRVRVAASLAGALGRFARGGEFAAGLPPVSGPGSLPRYRGGGEDEDEDIDGPCRGGGSDGYVGGEWRGRGTGPGFRLWVDALCINQGDLAERGRQLGRMRGIYGQAWCMVAWLGEESFQSDMAIGLVRDLAEISRCGGSGKALAECLAREPDYLGSGCWSALNSLMERAYWYRLWVLQELVMGASATRIRCGAAEIDWRTFCEGIKFLEDHLWLAKDIAMGWERGVAVAAWTVGGLHLVHQDLAALSEREEKGGRFPSFGRLLDLANSAACREPADKVYGLVGLMEPRIASRLKPDYTLPVAHVYASTARTFIEAYGNLEPIREGNPWGPSKTPSWAADWGWRGRLRWSRVESRLWCDAVFWSDESGSPSTAADSHAPYRASGDRKYDVQFSADGQLLTCSGFVVDRISGLGSRGVGYFDVDAHSVVYPRQPWESAYGGVLETTDALGRMLVMDRVSAGRRAEGRHVSAILHLPATFEKAEAVFLRRGWTWLAGQGGYFFRWENFRRTNGRFPLGADQLDDFFPDTIPDEVGERDMAEAYSSFDRTSHKRRFMTTANGYVGWAPDNVYGNSNEQVRAGDLIAILFGCSTPVAVRPCGQHFQVLGEAYVQGMMDGEAMALVEKGTVEVQKFTFC